MNMPESSLVLIPGLGVDSRFFHRQQRAFPRLIVPEWLAPEPRETLAHYAERLAAGVKSSGPVVVGGVSLGGMLALEMARHLRATSVLLIASCRNPASISPLLRTTERCARLIPNAVIAATRPCAAAFLGRGAPLPPDDRRLLAKMVREVSVPLLRWASRAIIEWPGLDDPGAPVRHIHGNRDWIIPVVRVRPTEVVQGGSHVLNLSHPDRVNDFIARAIAESRQ